MEKCASVLVTYNPNISRLRELIEYLSKQVDIICMVDNGSENVDLIEKLIFNKEMVCLIKNKKNIGIASAQNLGINFLKKYSPDFLIFFDQDSCIKENLVNELIGYHKELENKNIKVGLVAPILYNDLYEYYYPVPNVSRFGLIQRLENNNEKPYIETNILASSGSLIKYNIFEKVGLMKDELFIDFVDIEFSLRLSYFNFESFIIPSIKMNHTIGENFIKIFKYKIAIHKPFRRYYVTRNILILRKFKNIPKIYFLLMMVRILMINMIIILTSDSKISYLKYVIKGIIDGLLYKGGKLK